MFGFIKKFFKKKPKCIYFIEFESNNKTISIELTKQPITYKTIILNDTTKNITVNVGTIKKTYNNGDTICIVYNGYKIDIFSYKL